MRRYKISIILFFIFSAILFAQADALKSEALKEIQAGRYGEAIDLLNRYISARPQEAEGYNLRGLCFEKRAQYEMSVYDFRSARKLKPDNKEILLNLSRTTDAWYKLLYNKIEGHKREIALNSKKPINYLEIGKCYKNLGEWITAENWYDKYLPMEEASSDEIIRYTEILAKNNHTSKGIPILKKYTEMYPQDHRIWSRYGFFVLWEGKIKLAKEAFEKALAIRPYFKEAMDGLDQTKGKGYIYTINDTSYGSRGRGNKAVQEYAIDKYYKLIKNHPGDTNTRYLLIDELLKHTRFEEAYEQLLFMQDKEEGSSDKFQKKWNYVSTLKDSVYRQNVTTYTERFNKNNGDKEAAKKLSEAYANLFDYDNAIQILETYLSKVKNDQDLYLRYMLTKYCAWSYQWDKAFENGNLLIAQQPENKDYQLIMAQLISWNVQDSIVVSPLSYSKPQDIERAKTYLSNILKDDPKNMQAILSYAFLYAGIQNFVESMRYIDLAKNIEPENRSIQAVENYYYTRIETQKIQEIEELRTKAGKLAREGNCIEGLNTYKEVISRIEEPGKEILIEYAYFSNCAKDYKNAIEVYEKILNEGFDIDIAGLRAKNILWSGDTTKAIKEFLLLKEKEPYDYIANVYLGELYERTNQLEKARDLYSSLLEASEKDPTILDSTQIAGFNTRLNYLSATGGSLFNSLFAYMGISPISTYYSDNMQFTYRGYGLRADVSLFAGISIGATYLKHRITSSLYNYNMFRDLTAFKGQLSFLSGNFFASAGLGRTRTNNNINTNLFDFTVRYEIKDRMLAKIEYEENDARVILFAPNIINLQYKASIFRLVGNYLFPNKFLLSSYFHYLKISDGNAGNDFQLRAGRFMLPELKLGYEYYFSNYSFSPEYYVNGSKIVYYYAPRNFQSHSIWGEYKAFSDENLNISLGGKLGYVPENSFIVKELNCEALYYPIKTLSLSGKITIGSSSREDANYSYISAFLNAYLSIF